MPTYDYQCINPTCPIEPGPREYLLPIDHEPPICPGCRESMVQQFIKPPAMSMGTWIFHNPRPKGDEL